MKISDVVFKSISEVEEMPRFDMKAKPRKAPWYLQILAWILSFPETFATKSKIKKVNMKHIKGPYLMLCNHNSFLDFKVATRAQFPKRSTYVVAVDGFINREGIMRNVGCFGKRKFNTEITVVKNIKYSLDVLKISCQLYPEARYSLVGKTEILPDSLGKLAKLLGRPIVTLISNGHHLRQPVWNLKKRNVKTQTTMTQIVTKEETKTLSFTEINDRINKAFEYDDYKYQLANKIQIKDEDRAKNLHRVLYQCPHCHTEFEMESDKNAIWCNHCHNKYEMDYYGVLHNVSGETLFSHIPSWLEWIRSEVKAQIKAGKYDVNMEVDVDSLPNSTGYYRLGRGMLTHNKNGFHLIVKQEDRILDVKKDIIENYSLHIEFDYFGRGNGLSFSTVDDTYYIYPVDQSYSVTKYHLAVEELYKLGKGKEL